MLTDLPHRLAAQVTPRCEACGTERQMKVGGWAWRAPSGISSSGCRTCESSARLHAILERQVGPLSFLWVPCNVWTSFSWTVQESLFPYVNELSYGTLQLAPVKSC